MCYIFRFFSSSILGKFLSQKSKNFLLDCSIFWFTFSVDLDDTIVCSSSLTSGTSSIYVSEAECILIPQRRVSSFDFLDGFSLVILGTHLVELLFLNGIYSLYARPLVWLNGSKSLSICKLFDSSCLQILKLL